MKRGIKRLAIAACVILAAGVLIRHLTRPQPVTVALHALGFGPVEARVVNTRVGTIKPCRRAYLAPASGGQVAVLNVREGDRVRQGELLLEVWNDDLRAEVRLQTAEAAAARARAEEVCHLADLAEREAERLVRLQQHKHIVSEEQVDIKVSEAKARHAACRAAQAEQEVSAARVEAARAKLERTLIYAPFDGVVAEINAELGEFVTPSPPGIPTLPAIDLLDVSCLYVSAPVDEVDAPAVRPGMNARVTLDAFRNRRWSGTVRRVAPYVLEQEKQARTVEVEVEIADHDELDELLPGYSADIEVSLEAKEHALRIPTEAVIEGDRVLVYGDGGLLSERRFEPGLGNWDYTEVRAGLKAGERIVVSVGREGVRAGAHAIPEPTGDSGP